MSIFDEYASYYDLFYQGKDYAAEVDFVTNLLREHAPDARNLLDLGCGTGTHALLFAKRGFRVEGVDISEEMVLRAQSKARDPQYDGPCPQFHRGDVRKVKLHRHFDAVVSLFHVMSYQTTNDDLWATLLTAQRHLRPKGVFVFDCWYGPGVLHDPPTTRVRRFDQDSSRILRIAESEVDTSENRVDVRYEVFVFDTADHLLNKFEETHRMRYLFKPEVESLLASAGFRLITWGEWLSGDKPTYNSWNVYFVAQA